MQKMFHISNLQVIVYNIDDHILVVDDVFIDKQSAESFIIANNKIGSINKDIVKVISLNDYVSNVHDSGYSDGIDAEKECNY